jgi:hypothetical protein
LGRERERERKKTEKAACVEIFDTINPLTVCGVKDPVVTQTAKTVPNHTKQQHRKKVSKGFYGCPPKENPFSFQVEPFWVPCRTLCGKDSTWNPKRVLHGTKIGSSKGSAMGQNPL